MNKLLIFILCCILLPVASFAQRSKKKPGTTISFSTTFNYYPSLKPYSFFAAYPYDRDEVLLDFITTNSGTFTLEESETVLIERRNANSFPSQLFGVGFSVQIVKGTSLFHEISLTKLAYSKSESLITLTFLDDENQILNQNRSGYKDTGLAFGFRYEIGSYFGKQKDAALRFGLSGSIEPSFYFFKRTPPNSNGFPITAKIYTVEFALIPIVSARLSKKMSLDFKVIPNFLIGSYEKVREENPSLPLRQQTTTREKEFPEVNFAFNVSLRYKIKEPKKRGRR